MLQSIAFLLLCLSANSLKYGKKFGDWKMEHGKSYKTPEAEKKALENYERNTRLIAMLNADNGDSAVYGHTKFSDLSPEEFRSKYFPLNFEADLSPESESSEQRPSVLGDESFDWRDHGAVTEVKNQQDCGSCWAFSAIGALEGVHYLKYNSTMDKPVSLSVEQLIECDSHDYACYGGWPRKAYQAIREMGGLASDENYPYIVEGHTICLANQTFNETCGDGICDDPPLTNWCDLTCDRTKSPVANVASWDELDKSEDKIASYLALKGPVSVALDAGGELYSWLQFYKSGIADPWTCTKTTLNHGVLLVGYGTENGKPYWIVKNSWGADFGEKGYFRIARGKGACGINTYATGVSAK